MHSNSSRAKRSCTITAASFCNIQSILNFGRKRKTFHKPTESNKAPSKVIQINYIISERYSLSTSKSYGHYSKHMKIFLSNHPTGKPQFKSQHCTSLSAIVCIGMESTDSCSPACTSCLSYSRRA